MPHVRTQIRDAVKAALKDKTAAQDRVWGRPAQPLEQGKTPAILVQTRNEQAKRLDADDDRDRSVRLSIGVKRYRDSGEIEDQLDDMAVDIEKVIDAGISPAFDFEYTGCQYDFPSEGDEEYGFIVLEYEVTVITAAGAPEISSK